MLPRPRMPNVEPARVRVAGATQSPSRTRRWLRRPEIGPVVEDDEARLTWHAPPTVSAFRRDLHPPQGIERPEAGDQPAVDGRVRGDAAAVGRMHPRPPETVGHDATCRLQH